MTLQNAPIVKTQMLIRKPVEEVFEAFVNPAITTKFWYTKSSGRLEPGEKLRWDWEVSGASAQVNAMEVEPNTRIPIKWDDPPGPVEGQFTARADKTTLVDISTWGFSGSEDEIVAKALDSMGGFTFLLAGLKALLEHNVVLSLVADHYPDSHRKEDS